ncbi:hypothetical protein QVD17_38194 [Tagetes erecta]|uniref:Uncharacterized protein n=1 Tax=Tagetes erecta TaxID=13708 RepID=A0AAD8JW28_TARER|nr:hypothetical protein QVD17_38194 [Tagetes erecta]
MNKTAAAEISPAVTRIAVVAHHLLLNPSPKCPECGVGWGGVKLLLTRLTHQVYFQVSKSKIRRRTEFESLFRVLNMRSSVCFQEGNELSAISAKHVTDLRSLCLCAVCVVFMCTSTSNLMILHSAVVS